MSDVLPREPPTVGPSAAEKRVFLVDDEDVILLSCSRILEKAGYAVQAFDRGQAAIDKLQDYSPQVLLVDLKMPELDGFQVIERVRAIDDTVVVVVITGYATIATAVDAMKAGAYDFLPKPFTPDELRLIIGRAHERWCLAAGMRRLEREKADAQRRFVTFVSHQLKTPLAAVKQYVDVLLSVHRETMTPTVVDCLGQSRHRLDEMFALIDDWLNLAKLEDGTVCSPGSTTDIGALLPSLADACRPLADAARISVSVHVPSGLDPVRGDALALSTVVTNLLHNAIKYNRAGGSVTVVVRPEPGRVLLTFQDTGLGIPAECLGQLFGEFYRVRTAETRDIPGTGLGLAICKRIVDEVHGSIDVSSRVGEGTLVTLSLPTATATAPG